MLDCLSVIAWPISSSVVLQNFSFYNMYDKSQSVDFLKHQFSF